MFDVKDDAKGGFRRIEVLTCPARRRRWSVEDKAPIIAETLAPGARVSEVARRWQVCSQQVFGWRRAALRDAEPASATTAAPVSSGFVPIITEAYPVTPVAHIAAPVIEVRRASRRRGTAGCEPVALRTAARTAAVWTGE
jgi:transposase